MACAVEPTAVALRFVLPALQTRCSGSSSSRVRNL